MSSNILDCEAMLDPFQFSSDSQFDNNFDFFQSNDNAFNDQSVSFDDFTPGSLHRETSSFDTGALSALSMPNTPNHAWRPDSSRHHSVDSVPKSQRLMHLSRRDDRGIRPDLLNLEGEPSRQATITPTGEVRNMASQWSQQLSRSVPRRAVRKHQSATYLGRSSETEKRITGVMQASNYYSRQPATSTDSSSQRILQQPYSAGHQQKQETLGHLEQAQWQPLRNLQSEESDASISPVPALECFNANQLYSASSTDYLNSPFLESSPTLDQTASQDSSFSSQPWDNSQGFEQAVYEQGNFNGTHDVEIQQANDLPFGFGESGLSISIPYPSDYSHFSTDNSTIQPSIEPIVGMDDEGSESSGGSPDGVHAQKTRAKNNNMSASTSPTLPYTTTRRFTRLAKTTRSSRKSRTPRDTTPSDRFKNLTAVDRDEILKGVAPSGSSKTKARREREQNESMMKLKAELAKSGGSQLQI